MDTELFEQAILNRVFDGENSLRVTVVSGSSFSNTDTNLKPQAILNRVFINNTLRVNKV